MQSRETQDDGAEEQPRQQQEGDAEAHAPLPSQPPLPVDDKGAVQSFNSGQGLPLNCYLPKGRQEAAVADTLSIMGPVALADAHNYSWPELPPCKEKRMDDIIFDPHDQLFRGGAHFPLLVFLGGHCRRSEQALLRRDERRWERKGGGKGGGKDFAEADQGKRAAAAPAKGKGKAPWGKGRASAAEAGKGKGKAASVQAAKGKAKEKPALAEASKSKGPVALAVEEID